MREFDTSALSRACEHFDLRSFLEAHRFEEQPRGEWQRECPNCGKDRKLSCKIQKRVWQCWVCAQFGRPDPRTGRRRAIRGAGGILRLIQWVERCSVGQAVAIVFRGVRLPTVAIDLLPELELVLDVVEEMSEPEPIAPPEGAAPIHHMLPYLRRREISLEDVHAFGLFQCVEGPYANRLVFPVWEGTRLLYWQARAMWEAREQRSGRFIKALNPARSEGAPVSSDVLFNLDVACMYPRVAIVEGPIDAVHTGPDAVCTFGKRISFAQISRLVRRGVRAIDLIFDGPGPTEPDGAWPEMIEAAPRLSLFFDTRLVRLPRGDPGTYSREAIAHFRSRGISASSVSRLARI